jgi:predicted transcriptional regulator
MAKKETKSVTVTARITPALDKKLTALAKASKRTKSQTLEILIDSHVDDDIAYVDFINEGIRSAEEEDLIPTEEVFRRLRAKSAKFRRMRRKAAA